MERKEGLHMPLLQPPPPSLLLFLAAFSSDILTWSGTPSPLEGRWEDLQRGPLSPAPWFLGGKAIWGGR